MNKSAKMAMTIAVTLRVNQISLLKGFLKQFHPFFLSFDSDSRSSGGCGPVGEGHADEAIKGAIAKSPIESDLQKAASDRL